VSEAKEEQSLATHLFKAVAHAQRVFAMQGACGYARQSIGPHVVVWAFHQQRSCGQLAAVAMLQLGSKQPRLSHLHPTAGHVTLSVKLLQAAVPQSDVFWLNAHAGDERQRVLFSRKQRLYVHVSVLLTTWYVQTGSAMHWLSCSRWQFVDPAVAVAASKPAATAKRASWLRMMIAVSSLRIVVSGKGCFEKRKE